jgi:hypothetical protein
MQFEFVGLETSLCLTYKIVGRYLQHYQTHLPRLDSCLNCRLQSPLLLPICLPVLNLFRRVTQSKLSGLN